MLEATTRYCDVAMNSDGEVMDFDDGPMSFYEKHHVVLTLNQGCTLVTHMFLNTIAATKRGVDQGHNGKYIEVGPCYVLLDNCSHGS